MSSNNDLKKYSKIYLDSATTLHEIKNRKPEYWIPCFYLLSHSLELAIKSSLISDDVWGHDLEKLANIYNKSLNNKITDIELEQISILSKLNKGKGGLRYYNQVKEDFLPKTFKIISELIIKLLK